MKLLRLSFASCLCASWLLGSAVLAQPSLVIDGRNAATLADGPCWDNANRFIDCGNGTVTDTVTGLIWLKKAACTEYPQTMGTNTGDWPTAMQAAAGVEDGMCDLSDGSEPGDWRLPSREEWLSSIAPTALGCFMGEPAWTNDAGTGCLSTSPTSFLGIAAVSYWSSTATEIGSATNSAFAGDLDDGDVDALLKFSPSLSIWPVRSGR